MTKDKQIEEMARVLREAPTGGVKEDFTIVTMGERFTDYFIRIIAAHLVSQGYRKASEVAREIFEEIEEAIMQSNEISDIRMRELAPHTYKVMREAGKLYYTAILRAVAKLKKKYPESEGEG